MAESRCVRIPLKPGATKRFEEWLKTAQVEHREEMLDALRAEGMLAETICLERSPVGDSLVFYTRAENLERATAIMQTSTRAFDVSTRAIVAETWDVERVTLLEVLFEAVGPFAG